MHSFNWKQKHQMLNRRPVASFCLLIRLWSALFRLPYLFSHQFFLLREHLEFFAQYMAFSSLISAPLPKTIFQRIMSSALTIQNFDTLESRWVVPCCVTEIILNIDVYVFFFFSLSVERKGKELYHQESWSQNKIFQAYRVETESLFGLYSQNWEI